MSIKAIPAVGVCGAALIAASNTAQAQEAGSAPAQEVRDGTVEASSADGEIVVTARRRAENLQDVPISITAVSGDTLAAQGVGDLKDFSKFVPGVEINNGRPDGGGTTAQIS